MNPDIESMGRFAAVVITGGSSGIGLQFIKTIYKINRKLLFCNLSRTEPETGITGIRFRHFPCDLGDDNQRKAGIKSVQYVIAEEAGPGQILLINNSGFGSYRPFPEPDLETQLDMIEVNVAAPVALTANLLPEMLKRGGVIINVASVTAFQPTPYLATYGATKTFLHDWSLALNQELKNTRVRTLTVCPGPTATQFFRRAGLENHPVNLGMGQDPADVVKESIRAMVKGRTLVVTGIRNKIMVFFSSLLPRWLSVRLAEKVLRKMRLNALNQI